MLRGTKSDLDCSGSESAALPPVYVTENHVTSSDVTVLQPDSFRLYQ